MSPQCPLPGWALRHRYPRSVYVPGSAPYEDFLYGPP